MLIVGNITLIYLGATEIRNANEVNDPTTEEEFKLIDFVAPTVITWEDYQNGVAPALNKQGVRLIKFERNTCLQKSDYVMTVDFFNSIRNRDDWTNYRQALRDFPDKVKTIVWIVPGQTIDWDATGFPKQPPIIKYS